MSYSYRAGAGRRRWNERKRATQMVEFQVGDRVRVTSGVVADVYGRGVAGTVVLISTPGSGVLLYQVRMDPPLPERPLTLRRDEIEPLP
jgi:hypothetical protein